MILQPNTHTHGLIWLLAFGYGRFLSCCQLQHTDGWLAEFAGSNAGTKLIPKMFGCSQQKWWMRVDA